MKNQKRRRNTKRKKRRKNQRKSIKSTKKRNIVQHLLPNQRDPRNISIGPEVTQMIVRTLAEAIQEKESMRRTERRRAHTSIGMTVVIPQKVGQTQEIARRKRAKKQIPCLLII